MKTAVLALLVATVSKVLADEAKDLMFWLPAKLIRWASKQFPPESQARMEEEWLAHCSDLPGSLSKLWHGIGCVLAAFKLSHTLARVSLTILLTPVLEVATPFVIAFCLLTPDLGNVCPEVIRAKRIRRAARGFAVLGLSRLELIPSDFRPWEEGRARSNVRQGLVDLVFDDCMDRAVKKYLRLWPRLRKSLPRYNPEFWARLRELKRRAENF